MADPKPRREVWRVQLSHDLESVTSSLMLDNGEVDQSQLRNDVQLLRQSLGEFPEPVVKPPFIVVSGLPGTGKVLFLP